MDLKGKNALVTGAAKRVGRVIAVALAKRGVSVAVHYHSSESAARKTAAEIASLGVKALTVRADMAREEEVARMVREAAQGLGSLDILVNSAAVFFKTPFSSVTGEDWDRTLDVNLKGVFHSCVGAGRIMLEQVDGGAIVNIADIAALRPCPGYVPYCVSKAGVVALTRGLALTLAPRVRVNAVGPGTVLLPPDFPESEAAKLVERTPMKRLGSPEDVAAAVLFLLEGSDYLTGTFLPVDGGRLIA